MLRRVAFDDVPGWPEDHHSDALSAFRRSSVEMLKHGSAFARPARHGGTFAHWRDVCERAATADDARAFFERNFLAFRVTGAGIAHAFFTGYFEPEVPGRRKRSAEFPVPLYRRPSDLTAFPEEIRLRSGLSFGRWRDGAAAPYLTRQEIESGALDGQGLEIAWLGDWADAYFIHVQGSGRIRLEDGRIIRLTYDGKSGLPYTSIGSILIERGILTADNVSMQSIRRWMAANPEEARHLVWQNESFVFFREVELPDPALGAFGAQHVQLSPGRSLAIDRSQWIYGTPVWIDTVLPSASPRHASPLRRLFIAQDTGSAIKGAARGDIYWGSGPEAELVAGHMKSRGDMTVLLPAGVAASLGLAA